MSEPSKPSVSAGPAPVLRTTRPEAEAMVCERCGGANVYRMHSVWRCADCGFKTDCCGW